MNARTRRIRQIIYTWRVRYTFLTQYAAILHDKMIAYVLLIEATYY